jgi:8-oxo-dGTP pyrophosphatase MutT (NUDIX family)
MIVKDSLECSAWLFCTRCGKKALQRKGEKRYLCKQCGFVYFHNPAAAVAAIVRCGQETLFALRKHTPAKGKLDFPGGFVDPGESMEEALYRELLEELGWKSPPSSYLFSIANVYHYEGVTYQTVDGYFEIRCPEKPQFAAGDDVAEVVWRDPATVDPQEVAFVAMREALKKMQQQEEGEELCRRR